MATVATGTVMGQKGPQLTIQSVLTPKQQLVSFIEREHERTMRMLRAYPSDKLGLRPTPKARSAKEMAWSFATRLDFNERALVQRQTRKNERLDSNAVPTGSSVPESLDGIVAGVERSNRRLVNLINSLREDQLSGIFEVMKAPEYAGDSPEMGFVWTLLCDQINHRGQFAIYLQLAGVEDVPLTYGPNIE